MLRAAAHRLNRRHHVAIGPQEVPPRCQKAIGAYTATFIDTFGHAVVTAIDDIRPDHVAISLDDACAPPRSCASSGNSVA